MALPRVTAGRPGLGRAGLLGVRGPRSPRRSRSAADRPSRAPERDGIHGEEDPHVIFGRARPELAAEKRGQDGCRHGCRRFADAARAGRSPAARWTSHCDGRGAPSLLAVGRALLRPSRSSGSRPAGGYIPAVQFTCCESNSATASRRLHQPGFTQNPRRPRRLLTTSDG
jgi:hypothetical protein